MDYQLELDKKKREAAWTKNEKNMKQIILWYLQLVREQEEKDLGVSRPFSYYNSEDMHRTFLPLVLRELQVFKAQYLLLGLSGLENVETFAALVRGIKGWYTQSIVTSDVLSEWNAAQKAQRYRDSDQVKKFARGFLDQTIELLEDDYVRKVSKSAMKGLSNEAMVRKQAKVIQNKETAAGDVALRNLIAQASESAQDRFFRKNPVEGVKPTTNVYFPTTVDRGSKGDFALTVEDETNGTEVSSGNGGSSAIGSVAAFPVAAFTAAANVGRSVLQTVPEFVNRASNGRSNGRSNGKSRSQSVNPRSESGNVASRAAAIERRAQLQNELSEVNGRLNLQGGEILEGGKRRKHHKKRSPKHKKSRSRSRSRKHKMM